MKKKEAVVAGFGIIIVLLIIIQFVPVTLTNPRVESDMPAPPDVKAILKVSCYDCHSHETLWPWYSKVAPMSWLLASDAEEGLEKLNFSTWNKYPRKINRGSLQKPWMRSARVACLPGSM